MPQTGARIRLLAGVGTAAIVFGLDQITKSIVLEFAAELSGGIEVVPVLNLVLLRNPGISFGLLGGAPWWALSLFAVTIIAFLTTWLLKAENLATAIGLGAVIGGAIGNVVDRIRHGGATDFVDLHVGDWHWPAFNLADAAITLGVFVLIASALRDRGQIDGSGT